jgi:nucleotide-binding universal stress UspA family protein
LKVAFSDAAVRAIQYYPEIREFYKRKTRRTHKMIARTIVARAEKHGADMIVVGSRGLGDIEGLLRGGVSHRVETLAKCPVLVVK